MLRVCSKNTFLDFVESDDDDEQTPFQGPAKARSFGFESLKTSPQDEPQYDRQADLTALQLERLNLVLDLNKLQEGAFPGNSSRKATSDALDQDAAGSNRTEQHLTSLLLPDDPPTSTEGKSLAPAQQDTDLSELLSLQQRLGQALAVSAASTATTASVQPQSNESVGKFPPRNNFARRVMSNTSISTMANASDDGSDAGEARASQMRKVWSSGSVCTMVSEMASDASEGMEGKGQVEFELNVSENMAGTSDDPDLVHRSSLPPEFSHSQVPRNQNLAEEFEKTSHDAPPTTMMIRNIPSRYTQEELMMDLKDLGFAGSFDFLYMPMDKGTASNVGYAFVNFVDHRWATKCKELFQDYRFRRQRRGAGKVASVSVAHMQGLEKNLQHYENAAVNTSKQMQRRPVVIANISNMLSSVV